jgi:hypothetical protein
MVLKTILLEVTKDTKIVLFLPACGFGLLTGWKAVYREKMQGISSGRYTRGTFQKIGKLYSFNTWYNSNHIQMR